MGRIAQEWQATPYNLGSGWWSFPYRYDGIGEITSAANGLGTTFTYHNQGGRLRELDSSLSDPAHPGALAAGMTYKPPAASSATLGNGLTEVAYHEQSRERLVAMAVGTQCDSLSGTCADSVYFQNGFQYEGNGNVTSANDSVNGRWSNLTYDEFNRLQSGSSTRFGCYNWKYDRYGNRWQQNGSANMLLTFNNPNNRIDGCLLRCGGNLLNQTGCPALIPSTIRRREPADCRNAIHWPNAIYLRCGRAAGRKTHRRGWPDYLYDWPGTWSRRSAGDGDWNAERDLRRRDARGDLQRRDHILQSQRLAGDGADAYRRNGFPTEVCTSLPFGDGMSCKGSGKTTPDPLHRQAARRRGGTGLFWGEVFRVEHGARDVAGLGCESGDGAVRALWQSAVAESVRLCRATTRFR